MTDHLTEVQGTSVSGVFMLMQEGEEVGQIDVYDVESISDSTLLALSATSGQAVLEREWGKQEGV